MNPSINLVLRMVILSEHRLVYISTSMKLGFSYFWIKRPLSNCSCINQTGTTFLTLRLTILVKKRDTICVVLPMNFGAPLCSTRASTFLRITLFFLTALCMHLIYPPEELETVAVLICTLHQKATPNTVWIIPETGRLMLIIL